MKKQFAVPFFEVVRFSHNVIASSECPYYIDCCDVLGEVFASDECIGKNNPHCDCLTVTAINCW